MDIVYLNGYTSDPQTQNFQTTPGATIIEVWDVLPQFSTPLERATYFRQGNAHHSCVKVDVNVVGETIIFEIYKNDGDTPISSSETIPSVNELRTILEAE